MQRSMPINIKVKNNMIPVHPSIAIVDLIDGGRSAMYCTSLIGKYCSATCVGVVVGH